MKKIKKTIAICSSASFFKEDHEIGKSLTKLGFKVKQPDHVYLMRRNNNYDVTHYKTWHKNPLDYKKKTELIISHFKKIEKSDAILVVNLTKRGVKGYIGGNTLIEMAIAFYLGKPIYIYDSISKNCLHEEEIRGMNPLFINKDLSKIRI